MRKTHKFTKTDLRIYNKLLEKISKTDNLYTIRSSIQSYLKAGHPYSDHSSNSNRNNLGDCNGDGVINILDVLVLVNYILNDGEP